MRPDSGCLMRSIMDACGLDRDPEGLARAMALTEDLIGCEPMGELLSDLRYCPAYGL